MVQLVNRTIDEVRRRESDRTIVVHAEERTIGHQAGAIRAQGGFGQGALAKVLHQLVGGGQGGGTATGSSGLFLTLRPIGVVDQCFLATMNVDEMDVDVWSQRAPDEDQYWLAPEFIIADNKLVEFSQCTGNISVGSGNLDMATLEGKGMEPIPMASAGKEFVRRYTEETGGTVLVKVLRYPITHAGIVYFKGSKIDPNNQSRVKGHYLLSLDPTQKIWRVMDATRFPFASHDGKTITFDLIEGDFKTEPKETVD